MKRIQRIILILLVVSLAGFSGYAQSEQVVKVVNHKIIKQNGTSFVGKIISQDAREVLIQDDKVGLVYIPKHEIREIVPIAEGEKMVSGGLFSTRYFLTTNGFAIKKGDNYVQWNLFGPDFQFGVADNFTVGIMTSWVGMPIIGTTKYSFKLGKEFYGGLGFLGGTGSWAYPQYGLLLPFGFVTAGDRVNNINFSSGYGLLFTERSSSDVRIINTPTEYSTNQYEYTGGEKASYSEGRPLFSVAGMFRLNDKFSFVFDSFIMLAGKDRIDQVLDERYDENSMKVTYYLKDQVVKSYALIVLAPGLRFQANETSSFQFGFTGVHTEGEFVPVPIPMVQWFRKI